MPPRNPSELARLEEEVKYWRNNIKHHIGSKKTKEYILRQLRAAEDALGAEHMPYSGGM